MLDRSTKPEAAPRRLRAKAGAIDGAMMLAPAALATGATWLRMRREGGRHPLRSSREWVGVGRQAAQLLGERYGSPGQRLAGLRTVDPRSGLPVPLPRTAALAVLGVSGELLNRYLGRAEREARAERNASWAQLQTELAALEVAHRRDPNRLNAERARLYAQHRAAPSTPLHLARPLLVGLGVGLLQKRLRRRYAPSTVVRWDWDT